MSTNQLENELVKLIGTAKYRNWFSQVSFYQPDEEQTSLLVMVQTKFICEWIERNYHKQISSLAYDVLGCTKITYVVGTETIAKANHTPVVVQPEAPIEPVVISTPCAPAPIEELKCLPLNPDMTFKNFAISPSNRFAYAAAQELCADVTSYKFIHVSGACGIGKTHLMNAMGHALVERGQSVAYMTSEEFLYRFVKAVRARETDIFKEYIRRFDVLLFDDLPFIYGKKQTQYELETLIRMFLSHGKKVVCTASDDPNSFPDIHPSLKQRLDEALVIGIQAAEETLLQEIAIKKAIVMGKPISEEIARLLTQAVFTPRAMVGAVTRLVAHHQLLNIEITPRSTLSILQDLFRASAQDLRLESIVAAVAEHYGFSSEDIRGKDRTATVTKARHVAFYFAKKHTTKPLSVIGRFFNKDTSTIVNGVERIESDKAMQNTICMIQRQLGILQVSLI